MAAVDATWIPSWPRLEPTNGARPCLTRMCIRSSSALAMHIHRWSCRYSSLFPAGAATLALAMAPLSLSRSLPVLVSPEGSGDLHDLIGVEAEAVEVFVVPAVEV